VEKLQNYIEINVAKAKIQSHFDNLEKLKKLLIRVVGKMCTTLTNWTSYDRLVITCQLLKLIKQHRGNCKMSNSRFPLWIMSQIVARNSVS